MLSHSGNANSYAITALPRVASPGCGLLPRPESVAESEGASPMRERANKPNSQHEALEQAIIRGVGWGLGISAAVALYALSWLPVILE